MQDIYLGKTKLYNYSKGKDPKNSPDKEAFNLLTSSATAVNFITRTHSKPHFVFLSKHERNGFVNVQENETVLSIIKKGIRRIRNGLPRNWNIS
jgi:hypothetical protein